MTSIKLLSIAALLSLSAGPTFAACADRVESTFTYVSEASASHKLLARWFGACSQITATVSDTPLEDLRDGLAALPAQMEIAGVSSRTLPSLLADGTLRPLDDLVAEYGAELHPLQLIRENDQIVAIALSYNATQLVYREDILTRLELAPPQTWAELLTAAQTVRDTGAMEYPISMPLDRGWNLGLAFINMHLAYGGELFDATGAPTLNNEAGLLAMRTLSALSGYMDPEFLETSPLDVRVDLDQGKTVFAIDWSDLGGPVVAPESTDSAAVIATAPAPRVSADAAPATTLWWDGVAIAQNIREDTAADAFQAVVAALTDPALGNEGLKSIWFTTGYRPGARTDGLATTLADTELPPVYPGSTDAQTLHAIIGILLPSFFEGAMTAEDALFAIEDTYAKYIAGELETE